jgi:hypothetical protein
MYGNVGSEHESMGSECETADENREGAEAEELNRVRLVKLNKDQRKLTQ